MREVARERRADTHAMLTLIVILALSWLVKESYMGSCADEYFAEGVQAVAVALL